eukprot:TRINITY_DN45150_c0_g1_i1.p1 TRINITY_DN45150_c0_g1~~TRINITY_DN45150_c0_g1_i1.p1  ORF type:complete len:260 (+),score=33.61 TRINITY_DN45150_c0_g1_i1:178-957(+)
MRVVLLLLLTSAPQAFARVTAGDSMWGYGTNVQTLTSANFNSDVLRSDAVWMIAFVNPGCGYCRLLEPEFETAASSLKRIVNFGGVDCSTQSGNQLCSKYNVKGVPTIKIFPPTAQLKSKGSVSDYNGERKARPLAVAAADALPGKYIHSVTSSNRQDFFRNSPHLAKVLLFTAKDKATAMFKSLSLEYRGRLVFGQVAKSSSNAGLIDEYKVAKFPLLLGISQDGKVHQHTGSSSHLSLSFFLSKFASKPGTRGQREL